MEGKCIGFFGPTGSGKTTALNQLIKEHLSNNRISYCFQDNRLIENVTVAQNILLPLENLYSSEEACRITDFWIKKMNLENKETILCKNLSGGEKQRVNLARAFAYDGDIFLLDEPFSAQDENHKNIIINCIKELIIRGKQIYLVSHNKDDLDNMCSEVVYFPVNSQE